MPSPLFRSIPALVCILTVCVANAQSHWSRTIASPSVEHVEDVVVAPNGDLFVTGEFSGLATIGGQTLLSAGSTDVFVARLSASGNPVWVKQAGGPGLDRGLRLALGTNGRLIVAGQFMATADFQGTVLSSQGGSVDLFVADLDAGTGQQQWVVQGGGLTGFDRPAGVSVAPNGDVVVVGEFRETFTFNGVTLQSTIDPQTQLPGTDVFIAAMTAAGVPLWTKQGVAPADDAATAVVHDAGGPAYVLGPFTDTIAFDQPYLNTWDDAMFLMKVDGNGQDQWFRRCGGAALNRGADLRWRSGDGLFVLGELQGVMSFEDGAPDQVSELAPEGYFILRADEQGQFIASAGSGSAHAVEPARSALIGDTIAVYGSFSCQFTDLAQPYGTGVFLAVGAPDLFIARHAVSDLTLLDAQQVGGAGEKRAGGIAAQPNGQLVFTGSFDHVLVIPSNASFDASLSTPNGLVVSPQPPGYCGDPHYGRYAGEASAGMLDGFITRGFVSGRSPYDIWERSGGGCDRSAGSLCVGTFDPLQQRMTDTCFTAHGQCGGFWLGIDTTFSVTVEDFDGSFDIGPVVQYQWSTGSSTDSTFVGTSGPVSLSVSFANGCFSMGETVVAEVLASPDTPVISDSKGFNSTALVTTTIELCTGDTVTITCDNYTGGPFSYWTDGDTVIEAQSIVTDTVGQWTFLVVQPNGCVAQNSVQVVIVPYDPLPALALDLMYDFPQDLDGNDSLVLCGLGLLDLGLDLTWTENGQPFAYDPMLNYTLSTLGFLQLVLLDTNDVSTGLFPPQQNGWFVLHTSVVVTNYPCADTLAFLFTDSIHLTFASPGPPALTLTAPPFLCPGQSAWLVAECPTCFDWLWTGQQFLAIDQDSAQVSQLGYYAVQVTAVDSNGCPSQAYADVFLDGPPLPEVLAVPEVLCPDSGVTLIGTVPGMYSWFGPNGMLPDTTLIAYATDPGLYYCDVMTDQGCAVQSPPVEVFPYAPPFLNLLPDSTLCGPADSVSLQVAADALNSILWAAPLSGTDPLQVVDQPGIYSVDVTSCGIVTTLQVEIGGAPQWPNCSPLGPMPSALATVCSWRWCLWRWRGVVARWRVGDSIWVSQPGGWSAVVFDAGGCTALTDTVVVDAVAFAEPVSATDTIGCVGDLLQLLAAGSGQLTWYADDAGQQVIGTGPTLSFTVPPGGSVLYVGQEEGGCISDLVPVLVQAIAAPPAPVLDTPWVFCWGSEALLNATGSAGAGYTWTTPGGPASGPTITIDPVEEDAMGLYSCVLTANGCAGPAATGELVVLLGSIIDFQPLIGCSGTPEVVVLGPEFTDIVWSTGAVGDSLLVTVPGLYSVIATGADGCWASGTISVDFVPCDLIVPNVFSPNGDGVNDAVVLDAPWGGTLTFQVFNRWGQRVHVGSAAHVEWNGRSSFSGELVPEGTYFYTLDVDSYTGERRSQQGTLQLLR
ncbi:MAG: gliding motility-associated C-terminal domain-containing protein [Flavobacteriales bacterium]|nr:gliding motility-associated C-terminal domain-containing protein [Flavobacteriales bacterium]